MKIDTFFQENIRLSFASIQGNRLRSILTMAIIAIGIMSLVGIVTAIESIKVSLTESFTSLGAGGFSIQRQRLFGMDWGRSRNDNFITYDQAVEFRERFSIPASVALTMSISSSVTAKYQSEKSNPNLWLGAMDENGLRNSSLEIAQGRNFSRREAEGAARVVVIGSGVADVLFPTGESPLGKSINIAGGRFEVVGVSPDSITSHQKFAAKYNLGFNLIADTEKRVLEAYGVWAEKKMCGRTYMGVVRTTFVIDGDGVIERVITKVNTKDHAGQIRKELGL